MTARLAPVLLGLLTAAGLALAVWAGWALMGPRQSAALRPALSAAAPDPNAAPAALQAELDALAAEFMEPAGIAVAEVGGRWTAQVAGDTPMPQQSVSKIWVALALLDGVDQGRWSLKDQVTLTPADRSVFSPPLNKAIGGARFSTTLGDLMSRALIESDNTAADWLVRHMGGAGAIQDLLAAKGIKGVRAGGEERHLQAAIAGLTWRAAYGEGRAFKLDREALPAEDRDAAMAAYVANPPDGASATAIVHALAALKRGELLKPQSTALMIDLMAKSATGPNRLRAGLAPGWTLAHKTGTGQDWRDAAVGFNDVGLITAPDGRVYAAAVMIRRTGQMFPPRFGLMQGVSAAIVRQWRRERGETVEPMAKPDFAMPWESAS